jgi:hypothetical protein
MKEEIDPGPADESGKGIKNNAVSRKPVSQKGGHHERIGGMSAREAGINYLSPSLKKLRSHCQNLEGSWPLGKVLQAVNDACQDSIEKEKMENGFFPFYDGTTDNDEDEDGKETSKMSDPGDNLIKKR